MSQKVQHILDIWSSGQGVVSLHCFQNVIPVEAYTREACMVDAVGKYTFCEYWLHVGALGCAVKEPFYFVLIYQGTDWPTEIKLNRDTPKMVDKFVYLRSTVSSLLKLDEELNARMWKATAAFEKLRKRDVGKQ